MRANVGPVDLVYLLKRRKIGFDRYFQEVGINSLQDLHSHAKSLQDKGEFFVGQEMFRYAEELFAKVVEPPQEEEEELKEEESASSSHSDSEPDSTVVPTKTDKKRGRTTQHS